MAKPNFQFEKRQKELEKKRRNEEKLRRKQEKKAAGAVQSGTQEGSVETAAGDAGDVPAGPATTSPAAASGQ